MGREEKIEVKKIHCYIVIFGTLVANGVRICGWPLFLFRSVFFLAFCAREYIKLFPIITIYLGFIFLFVGHSCWLLLLAIIAACESTLPSFRHVALCMWGIYVGFLQPEINVIANQNGETPIEWGVKCVRRKFNLFNHNIHKMLI